MICEMQIRNYSPRTIKTYVSLLAGLSRFYNATPESLSIQQFKDYLQYRLQEEKVSVSTINQSIGAWRILQIDILKREWEDFKVKRPKKDKKLPLILSRKEALDLINALPNLKHRSILTLSYTTGLRRSEVLNLKPQHIDSSRNQIRIFDGKGHKQRMVPVSDPVLTLLRDYYKKYRPETYLFEGWKPGNQYAATSFAKIVKKAAIKAGIKKTVSPHILRHSFASHMLEKGLNLKKLQMILGHSTMQTTSIYLHVISTDMAIIPDLSASEIQ
jgi:site-specific recombinase XerD